MSGDDQRMHGGDTPGLVPGRGHERHEEPAEDGREAGGSASADPRKGDPGGEVASRSGTLTTADEDQA